MNDKAQVKAAWLPCRRTGPAQLISCSPAGGLSREGFARTPGNWASSRDSYAEASGADPGIDETAPCALELDKAA